MSNKYRKARRVKQEHVIDAMIAKTQQGWELDEAFSELEQERQQQRAWSSNTQVANTNAPSTMHGEYHE